jgi:hypothetical protein
MVMDDYKRAEIAAAKELDELLEQRRLLDVRIARLRQTIVSLHALTEGVPEFKEGQQMVAVGITDACRNALKVAGSPRTAVEVRDWLESSGYDLRDQANALASIHTVLKRLVDSGEAVPVEKDGKPAYGWKGGKDFTLRAESGNYVLSGGEVQMAGPLNRPPRVAIPTTNNEPSKDEALLVPPPKMAPGDLLRKAAGLPPAPPKKSALKELAEGARKKDEDAAPLKRPAIPGRPGFKLQPRDKKKEGE